MIKPRVALSQGFLSLLYMLFYYFCFFSTLAAIGQLYLPAGRLAFNRLLPLIS
ncbi:hypothetical protein HUW51_12695 [Adhaeribacter swui]|uniref:Uncharacterized protein n=1 Tax=Adhaeribacter swui TaxID=2086471 RepID=A0A7G7G8Q4_9BACT|nr:hypothetical protein [Adhaeribacter swui]QNF33538.1 hypothetical protein HUW51_12695 [Adhaeribacter swui]